MSDSPLTLDHVCEFIVDCLHATASFQDEGYPMVRTPNIGKGRLNLEGVYRVSLETYERWTRRAVPQTGDLILAREAPAGNVAIVKEGQQVCLGQRTVHLRPDPTRVDPDFLCYFLLAPKQQGALLAGATGVTAKHVNMKDIRRLPLDGLPNLDVQKHVAGILSAYDNLIENNRRRIRLLEEAARLLYREWFVRLRFPGHEHVAVVGGVPEGWGRVTLGRVAPLKYGKALKEDDRVPGPYPVYGSSGVVGTHESALVAGPGIIVGRKGNVGSVYWSDNDFCPIDTVYYIEAENASLYLYYALLHTNFISTDVAVPGLNRNYAHGCEILIANSALIQEFESVVAPIHAQISVLRRYNKQVSKARDLLLPKLMNGEVQP